MWIERSSHKHRTRSFLEFSQLESLFCTEYSENVRAGRFPKILIFLIVHEPQTAVKHISRVLCCGTKLMRLDKAKNKRLDLCCKDKLNSKWILNAFSLFTKKFTDGNANKHSMNKLLWNVMQNSPIMNSLFRLDGLDSWTVSSEALALLNTFFNFALT